MINTPTISKEPDAELFLRSIREDLLRMDTGTGAPFETVFTKMVKYDIETLDDNATPSVKGSSVWLTGGTTTITDFDDGEEGQMIRILSEHDVTIRHGTNIVLKSNADYVMQSGDTLTLLCKADGYWYELARSNKIPYYPT